MSDATSSPDCCIAGAGPAGMMLGLLLARAGLRVELLEKHADFFRDFRGDTIHPSTLELMHELGWLEEFLRLPHQEIRQLSVQIEDRSFTVADFSHLPTRCGFIAILPQWDFLDFLARRAARYPGFHLRMRTEATDLIVESGRVVGLRANAADGALELRAPLIVAADGRSSVLRERAGLPVREFGAPMDVLWFRLPRNPGGTEQILGRFDAGRIFVMINRGDYWQCGFVIRKGGFAPLREAGIDAFRDRLQRLAGTRVSSVDVLRDWSDVHLLTVRVDRLERWYRDGLLCIGDAAHAMSPVGGVGINLAIQDAVAAANLLLDPLRRGRVAEADLRGVQVRREFPTRATQRLQVLVQNRVIRPVLGSERAVKPPLAARLLGAFPTLRRLPARVVGLGLRPEHVQTPERS